MHVTLWLLCHFVTCMSLCDMFDLRVTKWHACHKVTLWFACHFVICMSLCDMRVTKWHACHNGQVHRCMSQSDMKVTLWQACHSVTFKSLCDMHVTLWHACRKGQVMTTNLKKVMTTNLKFTTWVNHLPLWLACHKGQVRRCGLQGGVFRQSYGCLYLWPESVIPVQHTTLPESVILVWLTVAWVSHTRMTDSAHAYRWVMSTHIGELGPHM